MILTTLEWISTVIFLIAGVVSITKYALRARVKIYLELFFTIANFLWTIFCIIGGDHLYMWVGAFYTVLGLVGIFNFKKIYSNSIAKKSQKIQDIYRREKENVK